MSLTLELEELPQDIYIVSITTPLAFGELVYFVNNRLKTNFILDKNGFKIKRNQVSLLFSFYIDFKDDNNHSYIIANHAYLESHNTPLKDLFSDDIQNIETKHLLQTRLKKHNYFFISAEPVQFNAFEPKYLTQFSSSSHISKYNKREQDLFQQIYYEKQS